MRLLGLAAATGILLWAVAFGSMVATGCTEPGTCAFPGELARDHGAKLALAGAAAVLGAGVALAAARRARGDV